MRYRPRPLLLLSAPRPRRRYRGDASVGGLPVAFPALVRERTYTMFPRKEEPELLLSLAMLMGASESIEHSEKQGQQMLVRSEVLPKDTMRDTRQQFEAMGIKFGEDADDIFVFVTLPDGWKKVPTDHQMWSDLVDDKGRKRAEIFYKAAFYDRSAHMYLTRRYIVSSFEYTDSNGNRVEYDKHTNFAVWVLDADKPLKLFGVRPAEYASKIEEEHTKQAHEWLNENYPNHQDPLAYWNA